MRVLGISVAKYASGFASGKPPLGTREEARGGAALWRPAGSTSSEEQVLEGEAGDGDVAFEPGEEVLVGAADLFDDAESKPF